MSKQSEKLVRQAEYWGVSGSTHSLWEERLSRLAEAAKGHLAGLVFPDADSGALEMLVGHPPSWEAARAGVLKERSRAFIVDSVGRSPQAENPVVHEFEEEGQKLRFLGIIERAPGSIIQGIFVVMAEGPDSVGDSRGIEAEILRAWRDLECIRVGDETRNRDFFLGLVSHELKTPLTTISGVLQLQQRDFQGVRGGAERHGGEESEGESSFGLQDRRRHFNEVLLKQVSRLGELIDGLLDFSRIRLGRFEVALVNTDLPSVVQEAVMPRLSLAAAESLLQLNVKLPEKLSAFIDPIRIEEMVGNMGIQALRLSPEGGAVWIELKLEENASVWSLQVRDQGRSLEAEERDRLFRPFETAQKGGRLGGVGLGLYLARQIARLHGGDVYWKPLGGPLGNLLEARIPILGHA